jgi:hypothetical protein
MSSVLYDRLYLQSRLFTLSTHVVYPLSLSLPYWNKLSTLLHHPHSKDALTPTPPSVLHLKQLSVASTYVSAQPTPPYHPTRLFDTIRLASHCAYGIPEMGHPAPRTRISCLKVWYVGSGCYGFDTPSFPYRIQSTYPRRAQGLRGRRQADISRGGVDGGVVGRTGRESDLAVRSPEVFL